MAQVYGKAFFDSEIVPIEEAHLNITTPALLYGLSFYTVFPVCMTKNGPVAFRLKDHFKRLLNSSRILTLDTFEKSWTERKFLEAVRQVVNANKVNEDVLVRVTVHASDLMPGVRSRGLQTVVSIFLIKATPILSQSGSRLKTSIWRRVSDSSIPARAKVNGAYVNSVLGKQEALDHGYDDCIFLDDRGHVCELSAANIFLVRDGVLITPGNSNDILEGITRRTVLDIALGMKIPVSERAVDLTELYVADEIFAAGTSAYIAPITEIDKRIIGNGKMGTMTGRIQKKHDEVLHGRDPRYKSFLTPVGKRA